VTFINLDGMAIFGPGSEWFWSMLQFALVAVTLLGIYRQLQAQRWATEVALRTELNNQWIGERMVRKELASAMHVLQGRPDISAAVADIANWMETLGEINQRGLVQPEWIWNNYRVPIQGWWATLAPRLIERRPIEGHLVWVEFERLAQKMAELDRQAGLRMDLSPEGIRAGLEGVVADTIEKLELERDLKSGVIPSWPPVTVQTPAPGSTQ
jgi:hypothetical protein